MQHGKTWKNIRNTQKKKRKDKLKEIGKMTNTNMKGKWETENGKTLPKSYLFFFCVVVENILFWRRQEGGTPTGAHNTEELLKTKVEEK